jgi:hypothetical protein
MYNEKLPEESGLVALQPDDALVAPAHNLIDVHITVSSEGRINISGFPAEYQHAMDLMYAACRIMGNHFMQAALNGQTKQAEPEEPRIIIPQLSVIPGGRRA